MRRTSLLSVCLLTFLTLSATAATLHGTWRSKLRDNGSIHLELRREDNNMGQSFPRSVFSGLTDAMLQSTGDAPAHFAMTRDAGRFDFDGVFGDGEGGGRYTFTPNMAYARTLQSLGITANDLDDERLYSLAVFDVSADFIREMQSVGYRNSLDDYVRFRIHGVSGDFVRALRDNGYRDLPAEDLVRFRIHGVSPELIRALRDLGYRDVSTEDLVRFRIHGVTAEFVREMHNLGYTNIPGEDLMRFRIHGVTSTFVRELCDLGYPKVSAEDLVRMRIHGVTATFIRELKDAGYVGIPVEKLIAMRIHGIDVSYVKNVK